MRTDPSQVGTTYQFYEYVVPIIHFTQMRSPFVTCVALDRTEYAAPRDSRCRLCLRHARSAYGSAHARAVGRVAPSRAHCRASPPPRHVLVPSPDLIWPTCATPVCDPTYTVRAAAPSRRISPRCN